MKKARKKYAMGADTANMIAGTTPAFLDGLMGLLEGQNDYSNQPIVNAQTVRNMKTPYSLAFGGTIDDLTDEEYTLLEQQAEEAGMSIEDAFDAISAQGGPGDEEDEEFTIGDEDEDNNYIPEEEEEEQYIPEEEEEEEEYIPEDEDEEENNQLGQVFAAGGYVGDPIKKKKIAKRVPVGLTPLSPSLLNFVLPGGGLDKGNKALQKYTGQLANGTVESAINLLPFNEEILSGYSKAKQYYNTSPRLQKFVNSFAQGGQVPIEVEDDEIVQTPDGQAQQMEGATHEEGGIDMNVPAGTRIYSDRLSIDGKTMQERKAARLRSLKRASQGLKSNPIDPTAKNTIARTTETTAMEEEQDMALQEIANKIYAAPSRRAMGGVIKERKYEVGGMVPPKKRRRIAGTVDPAYLWGNPTLTGDPLYTPDHTLDPNKSYLRIPNINPEKTPATYTTPIPTIDTSKLTTGAQKAKAIINAPAVVPEQYDTNPYTVGDYVGLAGNVFNAIAPLVNTRKAMAATKPNRNRFKSFGRDALDTNDYAQSQVAAIENADFGELETSTNTARAGNRNSARSVNTIRALDAITNAQRNKARAAISAGAAGRRIGLLGQRSQLQNIKDAQVMKGEAARDEADKMDMDNYYSNMAANLTNLGTNVQGIGKNLNTTQKNEDQMALMSLLNKYGMRMRRKKGKLVMSNT